MPSPHFTNAFENIAYASLVGTFVYRPRYEAIFDLTYTDN